MKTEHPEYDCYQDIQFKVKIDKESMLKEYPPLDVHLFVYTKDDKLILRETSCNISFNGPKKRFQTLSKSVTFQNTNKRDFSSNHFPEYGYYAVIVSDINGNIICVDSPNKQLESMAPSLLHSGQTQIAVSADFSAKVTRVYDGDLVIVNYNNQSLKIRLEGIDAPELSQLFGPEAKYALSGKITGKTVRIKAREMDASGCIISEIFIGNRWINKEMVEEGMAWHYIDYSGSLRLESIQVKARQDRRGLWRNHSPVPPWEYRIVNQ